MCHVIIISSPNSLIRIYNKQWGQFTSNAMANSRISTTTPQIDLHALRPSKSMESRLQYEMRLQLPQELSLMGLYLTMGLWYFK